MYAKCFKRVIDFTLSVIALIVLSPVLLILIIIGSIAMKGNPFFLQPRPGKKGKDGKEKIFKLIKLRTMSNAKDKDGNYIIPEEEFVSETTFIYPVNRTTFTVLADGTYSAKEVTVGYSRAIYYYETPTQQSTTRTYDVSTWAEGISFNTAITMESGIIGEVITVQNIDQQKEVYFKFTVNSNANYTFTPHVEGLTAQVYNSSQQAVGNSNANGWSGRLTGSGWGGTTYYLKLVYNTDTDPTDMKFTFSR